MNVTEIMTAHASSCNIKNSLDMIAMMMWENNCGAIVVTDDNGKTIGMVTDRDIAMSCALNHKAPWELQASTIMGSQKLVSCQANDSIEKALLIMKDNKVRRLPVLDTDDCLIGMLSIDDIIACSKKGKNVEAISYDITMDTLKAMTTIHP